jgi:phosphatidate cytidylyltransferase
MKTRLISAFIALLIFIPIITTGGSLFTFTIYLLSLLGLKELIDIKTTKKAMPELIKFILFILMTLMMFNNNQNALVLSLDLKYVAMLFLALLVPNIFYHDNDKYSINDAFFLIGSVFFLGIAFNLMIIMRNQGLMLFIYLFLITTFTDTYAYITGLLIGRHKLLESISPKKTIEGLIGGTIFGTVFASTFYVVVINPSVDLFAIYLVTFFLSILGQLGDLVFSSIKRYYGKKDFSNIMPGHGGVLDRLDSVIFVMLGFLFFIGII